MDTCCFSRLMLAALWTLAASGCALIDAASPESGDTGGGISGGGGGPNGIGPDAGGPYGGGPNGGGPDAGSGGSCPLADEVVFPECLYDASTYRSASSGAEGLHVVGLYGPPGSPVDGDPIDVNVLFGMPGSNVLVLSAYEATLWNIELLAGAGLSRVLLIGFEPQQIGRIPAGVPVESYDTSNGMYGCGYALPSPPDTGCQTEELIAGIEGLTGLTLTTFDGCYEAGYVLLQSSGTCQPMSP